ncbi:hypothetical protein [Vibrio phage RYC]|nr:hypothetical protein [Vibrio phage RYC]
MERQRNRHRFKRIKEFARVTEFPQVEFWIMEIAGSEFNSVPENVFADTWCFERFLKHSNVIRLQEDLKKLAEEEERKKAELNKPKLPK